MARNYTKKILSKDMQFISWEAKRHSSKLDQECSPIEVRIQIPYDPNDNPEGVLKALIDGSYDILTRGSGEQ